jgi:hypothetical protein
MKTTRFPVLLALIVLSVGAAMADTVPDTRFNVDDPSGSGPNVSTITSNQFVTNSSGTFDLSGTYTGTPIYSLELVIPGADIVGPLSCTSNVFLVTVVQASGNNPGECFFNSLESLGITWITPDPTGKDDPGGLLNCSIRDLDDCVGLLTGSLIDLGIPAGMGAAPNSPLDLAANGAPPLPFTELGSGPLLLFGLVGMLAAGRRSMKLELVPSRPCAPHNTVA